MKNNFILWLAAFLFTVGSAYYQRTTGPTYPITGETEFGGESIRYKLIRTYGGEGDAEISISNPGGKLSGVFTYKRFKSFDEWAETEMISSDGKLIAYVPHQPPAGKVEYYITLTDGDKTVKLTDEPVIIRFKGDVPAFVLIPHIILMFLAMMFSARTGIEAIVKGSRTFKYALYTTAFLLVGGLILGPVVQKYAFGAYWTGWPLGTDLTDNKTAVAVIFWLIAIYALWKNRANRIWPIVAAFVLLMIYLIPHSMRGSEIDHTAHPQVIEQPQ